MTNVRFGNRLGIALIEVMFASGVLLIAISMMYGSMVSLGSVGEAAEARQIGATCLASIMEEVRHAGLDQLVAMNPPSITGPGASIAIVLECVDAQGGLLRLPVNPATLLAPLPDPLEVRVTVTWTSIRGRTYVLRASAFRTR